MFVLRLLSSRPYVPYVLLAFGLSAWILSHQYFIGHDGVFYARVGEHIAAGKGVYANEGQPYTDHPPLYSAFIAAFFLILRDSELAGHLISVAAFALTIVPLFLLTREAYSEEAAHGMAFLYATNGFLLVNSHVVAADALFIFLIFTLWLLMHRLVQGDGPALRQALGAGMCAGLAYLTRPEGLIFMGLSGMLLLFLADMPWRRRWRVAGTLVAGFLPLFLAQVLFVSISTHRLQLSTAATDLFIMRQMDMAHPGDYIGAKKIFNGLTEDKKELKLYALREEVRVLPWLMKDGQALLRSAFASLMPRLWGLNNYLFLGLAYILVGASWIGAPWTARRKKTEILLLLFLATFFFQLFAVFHPKRYLLYYPVFLIWMGHGLAVLRQWAQASFGLNARRSFYIASAAALFFILPSAWYVPRTLALSPVPQTARAMGLWIKQNIPDAAHQRVAARHPAATYYAGTNHAWLPYVESWDDLNIFLAHQRARYFLVADDLDRPHLDCYGPLLDENQRPPAAFRRLHVTPGKPKMILYEAAIPLQSQP